MRELERVSVVTAVPWRVVVLVAAFVAVGCSQDLPTMDPIPEDDDGETGMRMNEQTGAGRDAGAGSGGMSMATSRAGAGAGSGSGGSGSRATESGGRGGAGSDASKPGGDGDDDEDDDPMPDDDEDMSGGASGRTGGGAAGAMPAAPVVAACMGRPGETVCDGAELIRCGEAGDAEGREMCMTAEQCRAGLAAGQCGSCDPGTIECMGTELRECTMEGEFIVKETCASEALCNETMKQCDPAACEADQHKCDSGSLLKCKEDLTDFEVLDSCPMELCDEAGKKCNVCVPNSKECDGNTLKTCSVDGAGFTPMECAAPASMCVEDRCVQCTSDGDCAPDNDCQQSTCNTESGMCTAPTPRDVGSSCSSDGGQMCNGLGRCVECVLSTDCGASERCDAVFGCVERAALQEGISLLPGSVTVTVNAGYRLEVVSTTLALGDRVRVLGGRGIEITPATTGGTLLAGPRDSAQTLIFSGPAGTICQPTGGLFSDTRTTLQFAREGTTDCTAVTVTIEAFEGGG